MRNNNLEYTSLLLIDKQHKHIPIKPYPAQSFSHRPHTSHNYCSSVMMQNIIALNDVYYELLAIVHPLSQPTHQTRSAYCCSSFIFPKYGMDNCNSFFDLFCSCCLYSFNVSIFWSKYKVHLKTIISIESNYLLRVSGLYAHFEAVWMNFNLNNELSYNCKIFFNPKYVVHAFDSTYYWPCI